MDNLHALLTETSEGLAASPRPDVIGRLAGALGALYDKACSSGGLAEFKASCQAHPLAQVMLQDPYSRRAYEKPRGYAGDAVMLDYIYRPGAVAAGGIASVVHEATTTLPSARSILWRRDYLAGLIHERMSGVPGSRILSVASGHMRELDTLRALTTRTDVSFVALDQDPDSVAEARASYGEFDIDGRVASFSALIKGRLRDERFDLAYSAGLFDYLPDRVAVALVRSMVTHLAPGGVVSIGNFARDSHGRGFMAGFMDWTLVYRDEADMAAIVAEACPGTRSRVFRDGPGNVVFVEISVP